MSRGRSWAWTALAPAAVLVLAAAMACAPGPQGVGGGSSETDPAPGLENGSFVVELEGVPIHYEVHGAGPVLMTVPNSWGLTLEGLRALYRPLEGRLTMVYFDPRGMGGSGAVQKDADMSLAAVRADFDALRRHLGLERVNAIGWSNGATNLIFLAYERPEILESAIFLHTVARVSAEDLAGFAERFPEWAAASERLGAELGAEGISDEEKTLVFRRYSLEDAYPNLFADPVAGREVLAREWAEAKFSFRHGFYSQQELSFYDLTDRLPQITARSLVLAGAHDLLPAARAEEMSVAIPRARFRVFEHSGHFAPLEEPAAFQAAVVEFLQAGAAGE